MSLSTVDSGLSRRDLLQFYYKYRSRLLLAFFIPLTLAVIIACTVTSRYTAKSALIVRLGAEYVYHPEISDIQSGNSNIIPFNTVQIFKSEVAILESDDLHGKVIHAIGRDVLFPELESGMAYTIRQSFNSLLTSLGILNKQTTEEAERIRQAKAVALFDKRLDVLLEKESAVITMSFEHRDPVLAARVLDTLLKFYLETRKSLYLEPRAALAQSELEAARKRAVAAGRVLQEFKRRYKIYSLEEERDEVLERRNAAREQALLISNPGIEKRIETYNRQLDRMDSLERDLRLKQKEAQIAEDSYGLYSHKYNEAKAMENLARDRSDSVRIIQKPSIPAEYSPVRYWIVLCGLFLSVMSAAVVFAFTRFFDSSFHTREKTERITRLPVLAVLNESGGKSMESMRSLVHRLNLVPREGRSRVIAFISARFGEGTSHVAWDYAKTLAEPGEKVLLVDAGRFSPESYRSCHFTPEAGVVDKVAAGRSFAEAIYKVSDTFSVCRLLAGETRRGQVGRVIEDDSFWNALEAMFDHIVVDAGSLQASFDGVALAARSDAAVAVIEAGKTPQAVVNHLRDTLNAAGVKIAGTFLNRYRHHIPHRVYKNL